MTRFKLKFKEAHEALGLGKVAIRKFRMLLSHAASSKAPVLVGWKYLADGQPGVQIHLAKVTWASVALDSVEQWAFQFQCSQAHSVHEMPDMHEISAAC